MDEKYRNYLENQNKSKGTIETYLLNLKCYRKWLKDSTGKDLKKLYRENVKDYICDYKDFTLDGDMAKYTEVWNY